MNRYAAVLFLSCAAVGCQDVEKPAVVLTQAQWQEVQKHLLTKEPQPKYRVGAKFADKIELIGFDVTEPLVAGKPTTFTWYWRALEDVGDNWKVFVHFDATKKAFRQNLDHVPVDEMYPTSRWKQGQIIEDIQKVTLRGDWPPGEAIPYIGFYRGTQRMQPTGTAQTTREKQPRVIGPTLKVQGSAPPATPTPSYTLRSIPAAPEPALDGKLDDDVWANLPSLSLVPFGNAPKTNTNVKAFVTGDALYIGATMDDTNAWGTFKDRDADTWTEEVLEIFIDVDGDSKDYLELQITPMNTVFDANFKTRLGTGKGSREDQINEARTFNLENLQSSVFVDGTVNNPDDNDKSWSAEIKIPLASLPGIQLPLTPSASWSVNVYRFDRPDPKTTHGYGWSTAPRGDFHQVDKFGKWTISGAAKPLVANPIVPSVANPVAPPVANPVIRQMSDEQLKKRFSDRLRRSQTVDVSTKLEEARTRKPK